MHCCDFPPSLLKQTLNMKSLLFVEGKDHYTIPEISTPTSII
jgi:hypothetical protein